MQLLEVKNLRLHYQGDRGPVHAVDDVSFSVDEGEALGIVGESGCGKTSLGISIMRILPKNVAAYSGSVKFSGEEIMQLTEEEFRRKVSASSSPSRLQRTELGNRKLGGRRENCFILSDCRLRSTRPSLTN